MRAAVLALGLLWLSPAVGQEFRTLEGHGGPVMGLAVSPDGGQVLSASFDYSVGLWDLAREEPRWLEGHAAAVNAVAFLPDGRAASAGDDRSVIVWDRETGDTLHRLEGHRGKIMDLAVSADGTLASAGWDRRAGLWDPAGGALLRWVEGHDGGVNAVGFSPDGSVLYTAAQDGRVRSFDAATGALRRIEVENGFGVNRLLVDPGGAWLAYGGVNGRARIVELATGATVADLMLDARPVLAIALSRDGERLAFGYGTGEIMVVDTRDWSVLRAFRAARSGPVWALAFAADGALLSGGLDPAIPVWPMGVDLAAHGQARYPFHRPPAEMGNGERQFMRKCSICHSLGDGPDRRAGPPLGGLFGRRAGTVAAYRYSEALTGSDLVWTEDTVDALFRDGPDVVVPGSKMPLQQIVRDEDRDDLIDFLKRATR